MAEITYSNIPYRNRTLLGIIEKIEGIRKGGLNPAGVYQKIIETLLLHLLICKKDMKTH